MANARLLATRSGNNAQTSLFGPFLKWKLMPPTMAPPKF